MNDDPFGLPEGDSLVSLERRGWIELEVEVDDPGIYLVEVEGQEGNRFNRRLSGFELKFFIEDEYLGTRLLESGYRQAASVKTFSPWLSEGTHRLHVLWDGARSNTRLQLDAVRLRAVEGEDASGNGVVDWAQERLLRQTGLDSRPMSTYVSPLRLEGRDRFNGLMAIGREALVTSSEELHRDTQRDFEAHPRGAAGWDLDAARDPLSPAGDAVMVDDTAHVLPDDPTGWYEYLEAWEGLQYVSPSSGAGQRFSAGVPLAPLVDNAISVSWQDGVAEERFLTRWVPYNLLENGDMTLVAGDSLMLTAKDAEDEGGSVTISIDGETFETVPVEPLIHTFNEPGDYAVEGVYTNSDGEESAGQLEVSVRGFEFDNRPISYVGRYRTWEAAAGDAGNTPVFDADPGLHLHEPDEKESDFSLRFGPADNVEKTITARAGENGPVLDTVNVENFRLFSSWETDIEVIDTLPDGSYLVEMMTILSPVPEDVKIRLEIFVGGVVFDDGTLQRTLTAEDFDDLGQVTFRFIMPEEAKTSICHKTYVYQGDQLIGVR